MKAQKKGEYRITFQWKIIDKISIVPHGSGLVLLKDTVSIYQGEHIFRQHSSMVEILDMNGIDWCCDY